MSQPFASNLRNKSRKHIQSVVEEEINCKIHNSSKTNKTQIVEKLSGEIHSDAVLETCLAAKPNYKANFGGEFSDKTISVGKSGNEERINELQIIVMLFPITLKVHGAHFTILDEFTQYAILI